MFNKEEIEFIKKQLWINVYVSLGIAQLKTEIIYVIEKNVKSQAYQGIMELSLSTAEALLLYSKILKKLEESPKEDNCSVILKTN